MMEVEGPDDEVRNVVVHGGGAQTENDGDAVGVVVPVEDMTDAVREKIVWGNEMRKKFSPKGMCEEDGSVRQDFFKPKRIIIQLTEGKRWGEAEKVALLKVRANVCCCCC